MNDQILNTAASTPAFASLSDILNIDVSEVSTYSSSLWPKGSYVFQLTELQEDTYEIRQEEHPNVGDEALMIILAFTCLKADTASLKDEDNKPVPKATAEEYVGQIFEERIMFGNDQILDEKTGQPKQSGMKKLLTLAEKILGKPAYAEIINSGQGVGGILQAIQGAKFGAQISHNKNPNDPNARTNDQIDMFGKFVQVPA